MAGDLEPAPSSTTSSSWPATRVAGQARRPGSTSIARTDAPQGVLARGDPLAGGASTTSCWPTRRRLPDRRRRRDRSTEPRARSCARRNRAGATGILLPRRPGRPCHPGGDQGGGRGGRAPAHRPGAGHPAALLHRAAEAGVWTVGLDDGAPRTCSISISAAPACCLVLGAEGRDWPGWPANAATCVADPVARPARLTQRGRRRDPRLLRGRARSSFILERRLTEGDSVQTGTPTGRGPRPFGANVQIVPPLAGHS